MTIQKYINMRSKSAKESPTQIGPSARSFAPSGLDGYISYIAKQELERKEWSARRISRGLGDKYNAMISLFHKKGIVTNFGNVKREVMPSEVCSKIKIIKENSGDNKEATSFFVFMVKKYGSSRAAKYKGKVVISWKLIQKINRLAKEVKDQTND